MVTPARILVVEDDTSMRELLHSYLARQGYAVTDADNSNTAMRILQSDEPVDLLLTDIVLPGTCDGLALGKSARQLRPGLKVLHVTGYSDRLDENLRMLRNGALMSKPVGRAELLDRVGQMLSGWAVDQNDVLRRAYDYWIGKAAGSRVPDRRALDPAEIKELLPHLSIFEMTAEKERYRCRLTGTKIVEAMGLNPTNRLVDDAFDKEDAALLQRLFSETSIEGRPLYCASAFRSAEGGITTERLLLPFASDATGRPQIVVVQTFDLTRPAITVQAIACHDPKRANSIQWPPRNDCQPRNNREIRT